MISSSSDVEDRRAARPTLRSLVGRLRDESVRLVRQEVELAKAETRENAARLTRGTVSAIVGGVVLFTGALFVLLAANHGLSLGLVAAGVAADTALWLAPLVLGALIVLVGALVLMSALRAFRRASLVPRQTLDALKEAKSCIGRNR